MSTEQLYIKNIENGIRAIKLGTKSPLDANLSNQFAKLKLVNEGMHEDLIKRYKEVVTEFNKRNGQ